MFVARRAQTSRTGSRLNDDEAWDKLYWENLWHYEASYATDNDHSLIDDSMEEWNLSNLNTILHEGRNITGKDLRATTYKDHKIFHCFT